MASLEELVLNQGTKLVTLVLRKRLLNQYVEDQSTTSHVLVGIK